MCATRRRTEAKCNGSVRKLLVPSLEVVSKLSAWDGRLAMKESEAMKIRGRCSWVCVEVIGVRG